MKAIRGKTRARSPERTGRSPAAGRAFIDLHCHTSASFDSLADPRAMAKAAAARGLTHLAITDHGTIEGALRVRDRAPRGLTILVGEEIQTTAGDLIGVFLERPVPNGLPPLEAIAAIHEQGGLAGLPHPFDRFRGSLLRSPELAAKAEREPFEVARHFDWVEAWNARALGSNANEKAAALAAATGLPGVAASDAHSTLEVGITYTIVEGDPSTPAGLRASLRSVQVIAGRPSYLVRLLTPVAKVVHRVRPRGAA